jgi:hypothetical protein
VRFAPGTMLVSAWRFVNSFDCFVSINKTSLQWQSEHLAKWSQFLAPRMQCRVYSNNQPAATRVLTGCSRTYPQFLWEKNWHDPSCHNLDQYSAIYVSMAGLRTCMCRIFDGLKEFGTCPLWCCRCNYLKLSYRSACKQAAGTIGCLF